MSSCTLHVATLCKVHREDAHGIDILVDSLEILYLFSWGKIPGNDDVRLIEFLMQNFSIEWIKVAKINKNDNDKTIMVTNDANFLSLTLNNKKTNVYIEIDDGRTDEFIVKTENGELNIYEIFIPLQAQVSEFKRKKGYDNFKCICLAAQLKLVFILLKS